MKHLLSGVCQAGGNKHTCNDSMIKPSKEPLYLIHAS